MSATALTAGTFNYTVALCTTLTSVDGTTYSTDTTNARSGYGVALFLVNKAILGDATILMTGNNSNPLTDTFWTGAIQGGVNEIRAFIVPAFGSGGVAMVVGDIAYYATDGKFYKCITNDTLPSAPDASWSVMTLASTSLAEFETAAFTNDQNELYYEVGKYLTDCAIEKKLSEVLLAIKTGKHTSCTFDEYEMIRRKYEGMNSQFDLLNYTKAQEIFEDTYNHLNSKNPC